MPTHQQHGGWAPLALSTTTVSGRGIYADDTVEVSTLTSRVDSNGPHAEFTSGTGTGDDTWLQDDASRLTTELKPWMIFKFAFDVGTTTFLRQFIGWCNAEGAACHNSDSSTVDRIGIAYSTGLSETNFMLWIVTGKHQMQI